MANTTTFDSATGKPVDYERAVEEGLQTLDKLLLKIEMNQSETAKLRSETEEIAIRIKERFKELQDVG